MSKEAAVKEHEDSAKTSIHVKISSATLRAYRSALRRVAPLHLGPAREHTVTEGRARRDSLVDLALRTGICAYDTSTKAFRFSSKTKYVHAFSVKLPVETKEEVGRFAKDVLRKTPEAFDALLRIGSETLVGIADGVEEGVEIHAEDSHDDLMAERASVFADAVSEFLGRSEW